MSSDVLLEVAKVHYDRKDFDKALETSEEFVRRAPYSARGFAQMGLCYEAMDQTLAALASYECATRIDPGLEEARRHAERLREAMDKKELAKTE